MDNVAIRVDTSRRSTSSNAGSWSETLLRTTEHWEDVHAWDELLAFAEGSGDIEKIRESYEAMLSKYPDSSRAQIAYIAHFLTHSSYFPYAESLFTRFLRISSSVELWRTYVTYVRRVNVGSTMFDTVTMAYDVALRHVGQDKDSGELWIDYLRFLKSREVNTMWEEQQKTRALCRVYRLAVEIPLEHMDIIWKEYISFEANNKAETARNIVTAALARHSKAKTKLRELQELMLPLKAEVGVVSSSEMRLSRYLPRKPTFTSSERYLVGFWKKYLKWEEGGPLTASDEIATALDTPAISHSQTGDLALRSNGALTPEERNGFANCVYAAYKKAVERMRFFPEIWFMAYVFFSRIGWRKEATSFLKDGIKAIPCSIVLNLAFVEALELLVIQATGDARQTLVHEIHSSYDQLLEALRTEVEGSSERLDKLRQITGSAGVIMNAGATDDKPSYDISSQDVKLGAEATSGSTINAIVPDEQQQSPELLALIKEYGLIYVLYMRFALRIEGVEAHRAIFSRVRKDKWCPWEAFEAAALMEYHVMKQLSVAIRIFNLAYNQFSGEIEFVIGFLEFLLSVNDEINARVLFERVLADKKFTPDIVRPLWETWSHYESQYGNLERAFTLENRMAIIYPLDPPIKHFARRHSYHGIDAIANRDLGFAKFCEEQRKQNETQAHHVPISEGTRRIL